MTESSISSLSSHVCQHAMDAQHRKCNRVHEGIPEAPQARCSAASPLPSQPVGKLPTTTTFCRRGMCLVLLSNCATIHPCVLGAHAVRAVLQYDFVFVHSFFIGFAIDLRSFPVAPLLDHACTQVHRSSQRTPADAAYLCETDVSKYV
jgi:hypothetical protein